MAKTSNAIKNYFIVVLLLIQVIVWNAYDKHFSSRHGFIYHPKTDLIYRIELSPYINRFNKFKELNPFYQNSYFGNVCYAEKLGTLQDIMNVKFEERISKAINTDFENMVTTEIQYSFNEVTNIKAVVPDKLSFLFNYVGNKDDIKIIDFADFTSSLSKTTKAEINVYKDAILISGKASNDPFFQKIFY